MTISKGEAALKKAIAEDDGDESWADDLPEADDLPADEDHVVAQLIQKRAPEPRRPKKR